MKRKLLCTLLCLLFVLCVLAPKTFAAKLNSEDADWGISLSAEQETPTGMVVLVSQSGGNHTGDLEYGSAYHLEMWNETAWRRVPYIREDVFWTAEAHGLPENRVIRWEVDWTNLYGELIPGRYRFVKEFMDFRETGDYDKADFYAEFVIAVPATSGSEETPDWGITLYAQDITPTGMTLITNQKDGNFSGELEYDTCYRLQVLQGGEWNSVPELIDSACPLEADSVWLHGSWRHSLDWERHYGALAPGHYRFVRGFIEFSDSSYKCADHYVEFVITDDHTCRSEDADLLCDQCLALVKHENRDTDSNGCCDVCGICDTYRVVGNADRMGKWRPSSGYGLMRWVDNGVYRTVFRSLPAGAYEFKVTKNGVWDGAIGVQGNNCTFLLDKEADVTVELRLVNGEGVIHVYGPSVGWGLDEGETPEPNPKDADLDVTLPVALLLVCSAALSLLLRKRRQIQ